MWSRAAQQRQVADDQQNANLRGAEDALRKFKTRQGIGGKVALARQQQKRNQHRDRRLPVQQSGAAKPAHQRDGSKDVHHVIHVEAIARTLLLAHAGQGSIQAVSQPVEHQAQNHQKQRVAVVARQRVADSRANLRAQTQDGELVGADPARRSLGHPLQCALLHGSCERLVDPARCLKFHFIASL